MKRIVLVLAALSFANCVEAREKQQVETLSKRDAKAAIRDARSVLEQGDRVIAICGPKRGVGQSLSELGVTFRSDYGFPLTTALVIKEDGSPDLLDRPPGGNFESHSKLASKPRMFRIADNNDERLGIWITHNPNGFVQTHNLVLMDNKKLYLITNSNSRTDSLLESGIGGQSLSFVSNCRFADAQKN